MKKISIETIIFHFHFLVTCNTSYGWRDACHVIGTTKKLMFRTVGVVSVAPPAGPRRGAPIRRLGLRARIEMVSTGGAHTNGTIQTQRSLAWIFCFAFSCPHWKAWRKKRKEMMRNMREKCVWKLWIQLRVQILLAIKWETDRHTAEVAF